MNSNHLKKVLQLLTIHFHLINVDKEKINGMLNGNNRSEQKEILKYLMNLSNNEYAEEDSILICKQLLSNGATNDVCHCL